MGLIDRVDKNKSIRKFLGFYVPLIAVLNIPQFIITYTTPNDQLKPTLSEHLSSEMDGLQDISGGNVYINCRLLGSSTGYIANRLTSCVRDMF